MWQFTGRKREKEAEDKGTREDKGERGEGHIAHGRRVSKSERE